MQFKTELFELFNDFKDGSITIDWQQIAQDKLLQDHLEDDLDSLIHTAAFLTDIDEDKKAYLLGSLVIAQGRTVRLVKDDAGLQEWAKAGQAVEDLLKKLVATGNWLQKADDRFEELAGFEEKFARDEVLPAELDYFAPVLVALSIVSLLHIGQEEENDDEAE